MLKLEGITDEQADVLMSFLSELTEDNVEDEAVEEETRSEAEKPVSAEPTPTAES